MESAEQDLLGAALTQWNLHGNDSSYVDTLIDRKDSLPSGLHMAADVIAGGRKEGISTFAELLSEIKNPSIEEKLFNIEENSVSWTKSYFMKRLGEIQRPFIAEQVAEKLHEGAKLEDVLDYMGQSIAELEDRSNDIKIMTLEELQAHPKVTWLIDTVLPATSLACIYGPPGSGKSFLALDMALKISCGGCFEDKPTASGACIYIAGEGISGLSDRVSSWLNYETIEEGLLRVVARPVDISSDYHKIVSACRKSKLRPKLLVIDTLARCFGPNDENSTADMQKFIIAIDRIRVQLDCTVLVIHHSARNERKSMRGNSTLEGVMDTIIKVEAIEQDSSKPQRMVARIVKQKDGPAGIKYYYDITPHSESAVLKSVPTGVVATEMRGSAHGLLMTLRGMIHSEDQWVPASKWREAYPLLGPDFAPAVARLVKEGYVKYRKQGTSDQYRPAEAFNQQAGGKES